MPAGAPIPRGVSRGQHQQGTEEHDKETRRRGQWRRRKSDGDVQGTLRRICGPAVHRPARQVAAHGAARLHHRRGSVPRRHHVRRLLDRRLEGDSRERHDPDARCGDGGDGSVRGQAVADSVLRHHRALDRPAVQPRPALDGEEGRGVHEGVRRRRHGVLRAGSGILRVRQREVRHRRQLRAATISTASKARTPA